MKARYFTCTSSKNTQHLRGEISLTHGPRYIILVATCTPALLDINDGFPPQHSPHRGSCLGPALRELTQLFEKMESFPWMVKPFRISENRDP